MAPKHRPKNFADTFGKHPVLTRLTANTKGNIRRCRVPISNDGQVCDVYQPELTKEDAELILQFPLRGAVLFSEKMNCRRSDLLRLTRNTWLVTFQYHLPNERNRDSPTIARYGRDSSLATRSLVRQFKIRERLRRRSPKSGKLKKILIEQRRYSPPRCRSRHTKQEH